VEIKLFDDEGNEVSGVGPEHTGELFVKSPSVFADYYKQHDKFVADSKHGYQTVGDIAYLDDEGYVYICDRKKDMIISGGFNIYPNDLEAVLAQHADVAEGSVVGVPSERWGETPVAFVVLRAGAVRDAAAVMAWVNQRVGKTQRIAAVEFVEALPRGPVGKVLKRELRERAGVAQRATCCGGGT
jgi:fatty-acyl-CoA synthase/long-chain acyl-CoA synthetase